MKQQSWMSESHMLISDINEFFAELNSGFKYWKKVTCLCVCMCVCMCVLFTWQWQGSRAAREDKV